jgi:hypothetical protein
MHAVRTRILYVFGPMQTNEVPHESALIKKMKPHFLRYSHATL